MADIQEAQVRDAKGKRRGNRQAYLLAEEDEGKVWFKDGLCRRSQALCLEMGSQSVGRVHSGHASRHFCP